jgi:quercetin dioxygenase-like cupin family protein
MIRTRGLRGLVVAVFAGRAGMAATAAKQADPTGVQSERGAVTGQGVGRGRTFMRRPTKLAVGLAASALVVSGAIAVATALPGSATPAIGATTIPLARGTIGSSIAIPFRGGTDVVVVENTFDPGGSSGWHSHPGGAIVVVQQGQITLYKAVGATCDVHTYAAGQAFFERPTEEQNAVNKGTTKVVVYVTFPSVPASGPAREDQPDPGVCPGV